MVSHAIRRPGSAEIVGDLEISQNIENCAKVSECAEYIETLGLNVSDHYENGMFKDYL